MALPLYMIFHIAQQINPNEETKGPDSDLEPWSGLFQFLQRCEGYEQSQQRGSHLQHITSKSTTVFGKAITSRLVATAANFSNLLQNRVTFFLETLFSLANNSGLRFSRSLCMKLCVCISLHKRAPVKLLISRHSPEYIQSIQWLHHTPSSCLGQCFCSVHGCNEYKTERQFQVPD